MNSEFSASVFYSLDAKKQIKKIKAEGKSALLFYKLNQQVSDLALIRNVQNSLKKSGFELKALLDEEEIAPVKDELQSVTIGIQNILVLLTPSYLYMTRQTPMGIQHVSVLISSINNDHYIYYSILEEGQQKFVPLKVSDADMKAGLDANGKMEIYGVYFDVAQVVVKPESKEALDNIAALLQNNKSLKLYIVGHTDSTGDLAANMALSQRRAQAVLSKLVDDYAIDKSRLSAYGVGPLSPLSTNLSEFGRAKNRRVELVQQ